MHQRGDRLHRASAPLEEDYMKKYMKPKAVGGGNVHPC
jgi:hypothetical protein